MNANIVLLLQIYFCINNSITNTRYSFYLYTFSYQ